MSFVMSGFTICEYLVAASIYGFMGYKGKGIINGKKSHDELWVVGGGDLIIWEGILWGWEFGDGNIVLLFRIGYAKYCHSDGDIMGSWVIGEKETKSKFYKSEIHYFVVNAQYGLRAILSFHIYFLLVILSSILFRFIL